MAFFKKYLIRSNQEPQGVDKSLICEFQPTLDAHPASKSTPICTVPLKFVNFQRYNESEISSVAKT